MFVQNGYNDEKSASQRLWEVQDDGIISNINEQSCGNHSNAYLEDSGISNKCDHIINENLESNIPKGEEEAEEKKTEPHETSHDFSNQETETMTSRSGQTIDEATTRNQEDLKKLFNRAGHLKQDKDKDRLPNIESTVKTILNMILWPLRKWKGTAEPRIKGWNHYMPKGKKNGPHTQFQKQMVKEVLDYLGMVSEELPAINRGVISRLKQLHWSLLAKTQTEADESKPNRNQQRNTAAAQWLNDLIGWNEESKEFFIEFPDSDHWRHFTFYLRACIEIPLPDVMGPKSLKKLTEDGKKLLSDQKNMLQLFLADLLLEKHKHRTDELWSAFKKLADLIYADLIESKADELPVLGKRDVAEDGSSSDESLCKPLKTKGNNLPSKSAVFQPVNNA